MDGQTSLFKFQNPFDETDLKEMKEKVKPMAIISHSQGFLARMKGLLSKDLLERERLLTIAAKFFKKAVDVAPTSKISIRNFGDVIHALDKKPYAEVMYRLAIQVDGNDTNTLFKYG